MGFDQKILLEHLNYAANIARDTRKEGMYEKLNHYLSKDIKGEKSRKNAATILMKIWYHVKESNKPLQKKAFELMPQIDSQEKIAVHWGMTLLAYPFLKDVASEIGRLSLIQHDFSSLQIYRKMKELYGERRRVEVASTAVLTSMNSWKVVIPKKQSIYMLPAKINLVNDEIINWFAEVAIISSKREYLQINEIPTLTYLFPFVFSINVSVLDGSIFEITNQGVDKIMIGIKKLKNKCRKMKIW